MPEHEVRVECAEQVIVAADPDRIRQCVDNVVSNAIRHSPHAAAVEVLVRAERRDDDDWGCLDVRDQGPGIPTDMLPRIFERFVAGPQSPGLGLGLYLAKRIAVAQGGDLTVQSPPGLGARFTLCAPVYRDDASTDDTATRAR
jgi:signal transduction histidine kinase